AFGPRTLAAPHQVEAVEQSDADDAVLVEAVDRVELVVLGDVAVDLVQVTEGDLGVHRVANRGDGPLFVGRGECPRQPGGRADAGVEGPALAFGAAHRLVVVGQPGRRVRPDRE